MPHPEPHRADRQTLRRMIVTSGYRPEAAAYEMASKGRDLGTMKALAAEIAAEVAGAPRTSALSKLVA